MFRIHTWNFSNTADLAVGVLLMLALLSVALA